MPFDLIVAGHVIVITRARSGNGSRSQPELGRIEPRPRATRAVLGAIEEILRLESPAQWAFRKDPTSSGASAA